MAITSSRESAFDVESTPVNRRRGRAPHVQKRETYKLNVTLDGRLKAPLKRAAIERDISLQAFAQELFLDYLLENKVITKAEAEEIKG